MAQNCPSCGYQANYIREDIWNTGHPEFGCPNCGKIFVVSRSVINNQVNQSNELSRLRRENQKLKSQLSIFS